MKRALVALTLLGLTACGVEGDAGGNTCILSLTFDELQEFIESGLVTLDEAAAANTTTSETGDVVFNINQCVEVETDTSTTTTTTTTSVSDSDFGGGDDE